MSTETNNDAPPSSLSLIVDDVERRALADPMELTPEDAATLIDRLAVMKARLKDVSDQCEKMLIEHIQARGDVEVGTIRYYVGTEKKTKCRNNAETTKAIVEYTDGDIGQLAEALCSDPWKHGHIKRLLGDEAFEQLFQTDVVLDLKTGKPRKGLKKADERFSNKE